MFSESGVKLMVTAFACRWASPGRSQTAPVQHLAYHSHRVPGKGTGQNHCPVIFPLRLRPHPD